MKGWQGKHIKIILGQSQFKISATHCISHLGIKIYSGLLHGANSLLVPHSNKWMESLTQDPVEPHLRRRRTRRLLTPKEREIGIQEYENGSSGTNIIGFLYFNNYFACFYFVRIFTALIVVWNSSIWYVHSVKEITKPFCHNTQITYSLSLKSSRPYLLHRVHCKGFYKISTNIRHKTETLLNWSTLNHWNVIYNINTLETMNISNVNTVYMHWKLRTKSFLISLMKQIKTIW